MTMDKEDVEKVEKLVVVQNGLVVGGLSYLDGQEVVKSHLIEKFLDHIPDERFVKEGEREKVTHYVKVILSEDDVIEEVEEDEEETVEDVEPESEQDGGETIKPLEQDLEGMLKDELVDLADEEGIDQEGLDLKDDYLEALKEYYGYTD